MSSAKAKPGSFKIGYVSRVSGVNHRTLDMWANRKVLVPSVEADGRGTDRFYSSDELLMACVLAQLPLDSLASKRKVVEAFRKKPCARVLSVQLTDLIELIINLAGYRSNRS